MSRRLQFQKQFSIPPILNIGSGEDPAHFGEEAVHFRLRQMEAYVQRSSRCSPPSV